jgi:hypothetical protein
MPLLQESYPCSLERWLDSVVITWVTLLPLLQESYLYSLERWLDSVVMTWVTFLPLLQESYLCSLERWLDSVVMTWVKTIFFSPQQVVAKSSKLTFQLPEVNPDVTEYRLDESSHDFVC